MTPPNKEASGEVVDYVWKDIGDTPSKVVKRIAFPEGVPPFIPSKALEPLVYESSLLSEQERSRKLYEAFKDAIPYMTNKGVGITMANIVIHEYEKG